MSLETITDPEQLRKINSALVRRVESAMDQQGNAFSLFQTAINLEGQVRRRTDELTHALRDIEQTNAALEQAKEESDRANLSKTKFLAAASHDVLQPLNAALLSISVLSDLQETQLGKDLTGQIERSLETMSDLLATLIDISKLDAGVVVPKMETFSLEKVMHGLRSDFSSIADACGLSLKFVGDHSRVVRSDVTMLRRILQNLISNGIRYTKSGGVLVGIRNRKGGIRIDVIDTGCGIPSAQQENIFEEFNRGALPSGHLREANNGLGLGLSIVRRMANALDHPLTMRSIVDKGSRFSLLLETTDETGLEIETSLDNHNLQTPTSLEGKKVLLIENDPASVRAMNALMENWKLSVRISSTSSEISRLLSDTEWQPDIIIADQHLDHGNLGTETVLHARNYLTRHIPALIITADPTKQLETRVKNLDMELMLKPIKPAQLRALLSHMVSSNGE